MPHQPNPAPSQTRISSASGRYSAQGQELRLDVEDDYEPFPQRMASGNFTHDRAGGVHWVVGALRPIDGYQNYWTGNICYTEPKVKDLLDTAVYIWLSVSAEPNGHTAHISFDVDPGNRVISLAHEPGRYRQVELVFAAEEGEEKVIEISDEWSIPKIFERAGFEVKATEVEEPVKRILAAKEHPRNRWSIKELHDAMQDYWDGHPSQAHRGIWVFFGSSYDLPTGGIAFDRSGPKFRQGCAIFSGGQPQDRFFTACHEIGHCLNLAHSDSAMRGAPGSEDWFESRAEPTAVGFMGSSDLPKDTRFRFSGHDQDNDPQKWGRDLGFLRHAPEPFVYPSEIRFLHRDSGSKGTGRSTYPALTLEVRVNRDVPRFEFMEPVTLELKLTNISVSRTTFANNPLAWSEDMTVIIQKNGEEAGQRFWPYVRYCQAPRKTRMELGPGKALYESLFVSAGVNRDGGWFISDPGTYTIQVALRLNGTDIPSEPLAVQVLPPYGDDAKGQEDLAGRFFSDEVGRMIAFHGSRFSDKGKRSLEEVRDRFNKRRVAVHADWALGKRVAYDDKRLHIDRDGDRQWLRIDIDESEPQEAYGRLWRALMDQPGIAVESFGHIDYRQCADFLSRWLCDEGDSGSAVKVQNALYDTMSTRQVRGCRILPSVLESIAATRDYVREHRKCPSPQMLVGRGETL